MLVAVGSAQKSREHSAWSRRFEGRNCGCGVLAQGTFAFVFALVGRAQFALMKPSAVLINVGRGAIVEEEALFEALKSHRIRGATIDAWYGSYPSKDTPRVPPSRFPFHELENLYMTPHTSAWTTGMIDRRWTGIADNLDRFARGEPLRNRLN